MPVFPNRPGFPGPPVPPPTPMPIAINPRPNGYNLFAGRLRTEDEKYASSANFISDLMKDINVGDIDPGRAPLMTATCEDRFYCELGRLGSRPQNDKESAAFLQKMLWKIAIEIQDFQHRQPTIDVFDAMARNDCTNYYCKEFEHFQAINHFDVKEWRA